MRKKQQKGQVILLLMLVMTVALAIGLSIVQKSLVDVSTASKVEQSSRAFSAAEAGIEKALRGDTTLQAFGDNNSSITGITDSGLIPAIPLTGRRQSPLQFPNMAKEDVSHVWLADYTSSSNPPAAFYTQSSLDVYWGNSATDQAAIELTMVYFSSGTYQTKKWFLDQTTRTPDNGFDLVTCTASYFLSGYQCKFTLTSLPSNPILMRARLFYNTTSQPLAVHAVGTCGRNCSLPPQARILVSTGASGETQRRIRVFQIEKVVPPYFDYAIFSAGEITK